MELTRDAAGPGPSITGFAGRAVKVDGVARSGGVILTPLAVVDWDGGDLALAAAIDPMPEFILYGSGSTLVRPGPEAIAAWESRGVGIEVMDSRAAARAWTLLRSEGRWISAALLPL